MKQKIKMRFTLAGILFLLFAVFTVCVSFLDVQPIGPEGSEVGLASVNRFAVQRMGVHPLWYEITEWMGIAAILCAAGFAGMGLYQLIKRKSIRKVDRSILALGFFYLLVCACYLFFEQVVINFRPVILEEGLEASYPSSHTMLVVCIMASAAMQVRARFSEKKKLCLAVGIGAALVSAVTVVGRLLSGVHWFTDIVGGVLLSAALVALYSAVMEYIQSHQNN